MDLDIKQFIDQNKKLFNDDDALEEALLSRQKDVTENDDLGIIISAYFEKLQEYRECENIKSVINFVKDDSSKSTIHELDRECSRSNRYLEPLCIAMLKIESSKVSEESLSLEEFDYLEIAVREALRKTDYVGKLSASELLLLLPSTDVELGNIVADKIQSSLNDRIKEHTIRAKTHMSYTNYERWESYELLLKRLKHGLFKAIRDKKNNVRL